MKARGISANLPQFALLVLINGLVGALIGQERTLIPLLADARFGLTSALATSSFLVTFGIAKAPSNLVAGLLADRLGRRRVMQIGWAVGLPVPFLLMFADSWTWIMVANVLLGVNQGLTWSTTALMKIDLAGADERGRAVGWNEAAGYTAVGISALVSGVLAKHFGVGFEPFVLGALIITSGSLLTFFVRETWTGNEVTHPPARIRDLHMNSRLLSCSRTGLVNNANDAYAWALLPVLLIQEGHSPSEIAVVASTYPIMWGLLQLVTGPLSDRIGRKIPIAAGMVLQAVALVGFAVSPSLWAKVAAAAVLGVGTALAYPALIAAAADSARAHDRASSVGFFRMSRDAGYAVGALAFGAAADAWGFTVATVTVAAITTLAGADAWFHLPGRARVGALAQEGAA